jgi:two-component system chemotaxis sensor kinase CheA/two-component system sensor histidine kinase and response regulator WspE
MTPEQQALAHKFREMAGERLARMSNALITLEGAPEDVESADRVARELHTLKGEAKLLGFDAINDVAHVLEEVFAGLTVRSSAPRGDAAAHHELMLEGFDHIDRMRNAPGDAHTSRVAADAFIARVAGVLARARSEQPAVAIPRSTAAAASRGPATSAAPASAQRGEIDRRRETTSTVRVALSKLDALAERADELLLTQSLLVDVFSRLEGALGTLGRAEDTLRHARARTAGDALKGELGALGRDHGALRRELQDTLRRAHDRFAEGRDRLEELESQVRDLRLLKLDSLFSLYPRAVRDLARQLGKQVRLETVGSSVEVDKQVLDTIDEPLLHLIRNAIDHGVERSSERVAAGKPEVAQVRIEALQRGSTVAITVEDDGRGVVVDEVIEQASRRGVLPTGSGAELDERTLIELLFTPGFTTKAEASDVGGRGIGLDVVKSRIAELGGTVTFSSRHGQGTRCTLRVPVSLVRAPVLVFSLGSAYYALPSAAVAGVARLNGEAHAGPRATLRFQERLVPLASMGELLGIESARREDPEIAIVLEHGSLRLACAVDAVAQERRVIQHRLGALVSGLSLVSGTALGDDGALVLVLNAAELFEAARQVRPASVGGAARRSEEQGRTRVVIADDSELTRDMMVNLVRRAGYDAVEAVDGRDALAHMEREVPALVITDLEMPVVDGFELLRRLRASKKLGHVPIIVCSTRGSDADKRRAAELGADAYVVKAEFEERELLALIERFIDEERA